MKLKIFFILIVVISMLVSKPTQAAPGLMYEEIIDGYSRINGETLRWSMNREFIINNYEFGTQNINGSISKIVRIEMLDRGQNGQLENITQPLKGVNFELYPEFLPDGRVSQFSWDIYLFRDVEHPNIDTNPEDNTIKSNFRLPHRQFDLDSSKTFFSVNLEYWEYKNISGTVQKLRVNTELSTKNFEDGRVDKSAIHTIKRDENSNILFEFNWEIQETSSIQRNLNLLDQPYLLVPYQIGAVFLLVFLYIKTHQYLVANEITITRGKKRMEDEKSKENTVEKIERKSDEEESDKSDK